MAKAWIGALALGTVLLAVIAGQLEGAAKFEPPTPEPYRPEWLSREATAHIFGGDEYLGPLFAGVWPGGRAPTLVQRTRIVEYGRANNVDIDLEVVDDELIAIRASVKFGGCCGYEGADLLGRFLRRPYWTRCCGCGEKEWVDDWTVNDDDSGMGIHVRAKVRFNRVVVRWEKAITREELLARADGLVGQARGDVRRASADHWRELEKGTRYLLEVPHRFRHEHEVTTNDLTHRTDLGLHVRVGAGGTIDEVSFAIRDVGDDVLEMMNKRWGRSRAVPRVNEDDVEGHTWNLKDRTITALGREPARITITKK